MNSWSASGCRSASLTYSSSSSSSMANRSPGSWSRAACSEDCSGGGAEEQDQVWGGGVFGSSLAPSGYRFKTQPAMDTTWTCQQQEWDKTRLDLSGGHKWTGTDKLVRISQARDRWGSEKQNQSWDAQRF